MSETLEQRQAERILRIADVVARTGLSRASIYRQIVDKAFPASVPLGRKLVGWRDSDVTHWIDTRGPASTFQTDVLAEEDIQAADDLGIAKRLRSSQGRGSRSMNANARLSVEEHKLLKEAARAKGQMLGEWSRDVLLNAARYGQTDRVLLTEIAALRLLLNNVLRPLALGETITAQQYQAILTDARKAKHDAARDLLAQYKPNREL